MALMIDVDSSLLGSHAWSLHTRLHSFDHGLVTSRHLLQADIHTSLLYVPLCLTMAGLLI